MHSVSRLLPALKHIMLQDVLVYGLLPRFAQLVFHLILCNVADAGQCDSVGCEVVRSPALAWLLYACMADDRLGLLVSLAVVGIN